MTFGLTILKVLAVKGLVSSVPETLTVRSVVMYPVPNLFRFSSTSRATDSETTREFLCPCIAGSIRRLN